jgi:hypothetical protein
VFSEQTKEEKKKNEKKKNEKFGETTRAHLDKQGTSVVPPSWSHLLILITVTLTSVHLSALNNNSNLLWVSF